MCGITGIIVSRDSTITEDWLYRPCTLLAHRGPDHTGYWVSDHHRVGLGHCRLAILDLSANGNQPMAITYHNRRYVIVFNGEIYNFPTLRKELEGQGHEFTTRCDTEILLHAYLEWGRHCLPKLRGMFAFALYDLDREEVFFGRDRAGEKPLFYYQKNGCLIFASEIKAMLAYPNIDRTLNYDAVNEYLEHGYVSGSSCIFQFMNKLPAAHGGLLRLSDMQFERWRYWSLPEFSDTPAATASELRDELEVRLTAAVKHQLVADVPVGILLSGGMDSSLLTAVAVKNVPRLMTFTVTLPGQKVFDESRHARLIADYFGTSHHELALREPNPEIMDRLAVQYDEPLGDSSLVPTSLLSELVSQHCKVVLGGDGGDELFGGYTYYSRLCQLARIDWMMPWPLQKLLAPFIYRLPYTLRGSSFCRQWVTPSWKRFTAITFFEFPWRQQLLARQMGKMNLPLMASRQLRAQRFGGNRNFLRNAMTADFNTYLPDDILMKVDRASMLSSLEVRVPWLDQEVIDFAFRKVPDCLKTTPRHRKILPRLLAKKLLPPEFDLDRKQGFSIPLDSWKSDKWGKHMEEILRDRRSDFFSRPTVERILTYMRRTNRGANHVFMLAMFELWRQNYAR